MNLLFLILDYMIDNCKNCEFLLSSCIEDRNCFKYLETICRMLDPPRENIAKCWEGLAMFYSKELNIDQSIIDSIKYVYSPVHTYYSVCNDDVQEIKFVVL